MFASASGKTSSALCTGSSILQVAILLFATLLPLACAPNDLDPPSVLLVSADSLRVDRLKPWNPEAAAEVPALMSLGRRGTVYTDAWATAPWTAPSIVSLFTGLYPPSHGVAYRDDTTPRHLPTLPRLLAARGYRLGNFAFFSGISYFRNLGLPPPEEGLSHAQVAPSFRAWLQTLPPQEPCFAWIHLLEPHLPYGATGYQATQVQVHGSSGLEQAQLRAAVPVGTVRFDEGDLERLLALYDRDVEAMDRALGEILQALADSGREEGTLVIFVADHGEELLDDGWIGHASTSKEAKLLPQILHIPLLVAGPGAPRGQVRRELVQPVDVFATLVQLLRLEAPEVVDGTPLPGFDDGGLGGWLRSPRTRVFFDSSPGGNLTPQERRGERLQGVADGRCLLAERLVPGREETQDARALRPPGCTPTRVRDLAASLAAWRLRQGRQRLTLLAGDETAEVPPTEEVDRYPATIRVLMPAPGSALTWEAMQGQVLLAWESEGGDETAGPWWVVYQAGHGVTALSGSFVADQRRLAFGPFPQGFWDDLAAYSPLRFRVVASGAEERSEWVQFSVSPHGKP